MNKLLNSLLLPSLLISNISLALPGDLEQDMITTCPARSESFLDQGLEICRGTSDEPAQISQGSLKLSGLEFRIEREQGFIRMITATGSPATFQQQPELDQAIAYASGATIIFNNETQVIIIQGDAAFSQEGTIDTTAERIEYDIANRKLDATQMNMVIPATANP
ncbi:MAG: LptA/OstA family protein [Pseudohongiellaceae bacterium]